MSMSTIEQRQIELIEQFSKIENWEKKYRHIITLGKDLQGLDEDDKHPDNLVKGCQSQVWLVASPRNNEKIVFCADSDAVLVRGLISLVLRVYSDATPDEILQTEPRFLKDIGLFNNLSASRANGLQSIVKKIHYFAFAYQNVFEKSKNL